ncbi:MAG: pre-16S rRNA-processing nuclease YqgF [Microcoleaceae cyanobacterium]
MILGFDPGRDKCGIAVVDAEVDTDGQVAELSTQSVIFHHVVAADEVIPVFQSICQRFLIDKIVMGNQTTSRLWQQKLQGALPDLPTITLVNERYSSLEARDRYWQMYPPNGLTRLIPQGMRTPPRPIDDIVAIILVERYLAL